VDVMSVPDSMRRIEAQIDNAIQQLPIWKHSKDVLLRSILKYYRDIIEMLMLEGVHEAFTQGAISLRYSVGQEHILRYGVFQALKWAMQFAPQSGRGKPPSLNKLKGLIKLGSNYEVVVDYLKSTKQKMTEISVDEAARMITVYGGGDQTGHDAQLVLHQQQSLLNYSHIDLTFDEDQLTTRWNASQFRAVIRHLMRGALHASDTFIFDDGKVTLPLFPRPTVFEISDFAEPSLQCVLEDLTLRPEILQGAGQWRQTSFLDTPLVMVGRKRFGVSDILIALGQRPGYDYMLRLASRVDPDQYSKVSGLREERMMGICRKEFEQENWQVDTSIKLRSPCEREIDFLARRNNLGVLIQLKSTLRPESPGEVYYRNQDILHGITHTHEVLQMLSEPHFPFVITDGYRGDYNTWAYALNHSVPIGTLRDLSDIAKDPAQAFELLKERVGFDPTAPVESIPDREFEIMGWKVRLVDAPRP
jgi:hypothetical protein